MKRTVTTTKQADEDYLAVMKYSAIKYGPRTALRYISLIDKAVADLADQPVRPGIAKCFDIRDGFYSYHLKHSKRKIVPKRERIQKPRHLIVFRLPSANQLQVVRILHDRMKLAKQQFDEV